MSEKKILVVSGITDDDCFYITKEEYDKERKKRENFKYNERLFDDDIIWIK